MIKTYRMEMDPNNFQITFLKDHIDASRFVYNWGLEINLERVKNNQKILGYPELCKKLTEFKNIHSNNWLKNIGAHSLQASLKNLDQSFTYYFKRLKNPKIKKKGFPKFKSKKNNFKYFIFPDYVFYKNEGYINFPRIGKIKLKEKDYLPLNCKIRQAIITNKINRWYVSLKIENEDIKLNELISTKTIGVDLGIRNLATLSDNTTFENPKALAKNLKKLKRLDRQHSRKQKGSKNKEKSRIKLAKLHAHISNIRKDALHKATTSIILENKKIIMEDLKVSNLIKNKNLSKAILDVGFYEFRRQIEYKAKWYGREVQLVDTFFPSSKLCSNCGNKKEDLKLSARIYKCDKCGFVLDRDLNAAINLENQYNENLIKNTDGSSEIHASGERSSVENVNSKHSLSEKEESHISKENKL